MSLKPCERCGKQPALISDGYTFRYACSCLRREYDSRKSAAEYWNTRTPDKEAAWEVWSSAWEFYNCDTKYEMDLIRKEFEQYWRTKNPDKA